MGGNVEKWRGMRLDGCREALRANGFAAWVVRDAAEAQEVVRREILTPDQPATASFGDSMTAQALGVVDQVREWTGSGFIHTFEPGVARAEILERRRQALLADLFVTGANAVTLDGKLVNLDMVGNRIAGLMFGPRRVLVCAGRNKLSLDLAAAMHRVKSLAAPMNALRHRVKTPCVKTGRCMDCKSPERICNTWSILEKCHPKGRIAVLLADADLGL